VDAFLKVKWSETSPIDLSSTNAKVIHRDMQVYYEVDFGDGTYSSDMMPEDIDGLDESNQPEEGTSVKVKWTDGEWYICTFLGLNKAYVYTLEFDDGVQLKKSHKELVEMIREADESKHNTPKKRGRKRKIPSDQPSTSASFLSVLSPPITSPSSQLSSSPNERVSVDAISSILQMNPNEFGIDAEESDMDFEELFDKSGDDSDDDEPFEVGKSGSSRNKKRKTNKKGSSDNGKHRIEKRKKKNN